MLDHPEPTTPPQPELELWAPVPDAPLYEVSSWGRVRRGEFDVASWPNKKGYHCVSLELASGRIVLRYVHRLVLSAFVAPADATNQTNHEDGKKGHNALGNLAWTTRSENMAHAWAHGLIPRTRTPRTACRLGHPLDQVAAQLDRSGIVRTWRRCGRCRRVAARTVRDRAVGQRSLLNDSTDTVDHVQP